MDTYHDDSTYIFEEDDEPHCNGCLKQIEDGAVVQFGDGIWHTECFACTKCHKLVECYNSHLLLREGRPVCEECSYNCHGCRKAIEDEAIMTGDEAYHAECFKCVQCGIKIDDLVFTQTSKGIFCTACHEMRKQMRQKRKGERLLQQQQQQQQQQPTASQSRQREPIASNSARMAKERRGGVFDGDPRIDPLNGAAAPQTFAPIRNTIISSQELQELNQMLNVTDPIDMMPSPPRTSPSSDVTSKSFSTANDDNVSVDALPPASLSQSERISQLERELQSTRKQLKEMDTQFNKVKAISRKALDEFHVVKESYNAEVAARQAAEALVARLKAELIGYHQARHFGPAESAKMIKDEITQLAQSKVDLEYACKELRYQREFLVAEVSNTAANHLATNTIRERVHQTYQLQLRSILTDTEAAKANFAQMSKARDDILHEMIMLNTKNAELTTLNNDLSRRVMVREREALAVMAGTNFLGEEPGLTGNEAQLGSVTLERKSSEHQKTAQRDSIGKAEPAKMFKFRRNKSNNVFSRRNNSSGSNASSSSRRTAADDDSLGVPYDANTPSRASPNGSDQKQQQQLQREDQHKKTSQESAIKELVIQERARQTKRAHNFTQTRFLRPTKCDVCSEKIWRASELKCQDCGHVSHVRCLHHVPNQCNGRASQDNENQVKPMFGNDLAEQVRLENGMIPMVVQTCIEAVEARGMDFEGIYRRSGAAGQMRQIQQAFDTADTSCDLKNEDQWNDVCAITSVLKQYFRDLPNPLFTYEYHTRFMDAARATTSDQQHILYQGAIHSLPSVNYNTLKYLMSHLDRVCQRQKENLMTSKNLAVIFGPTLMRNRDESGDLLDMNCKISSVDFIISHFTTLFADPQPSKENHSSPLPTSSSSSTRRNSLANAAARSKQHRREFSTDDLLRSIPPALPPRENANYI